MLCRSYVPESVSQSVSQSVKFGEARSINDVSLVYSRRRPDTHVILYSVQCYALHWTDKNMQNSNTHKMHCTGQTKTCKTVTPTKYPKLNPAIPVRTAQVCVLITVLQTDRQTDRQANMQPSELNFKRIIK